MMFSKINNYYQQQKEYMKKIINIKKIHRFKLMKDEYNNNYIIEIYYKDKLKLRAKYNVIGMYNIINSVWYWSWNISNIDKQLITNSLKIKEFSEELNNNYSKYNKTEIDELYYLTSNGNFYIDGDNIKKLIKIALFINKGIWYIPISINKNNEMDINEEINLDNILKIEYLIITEIINI